MSNLPPLPEGFIVAPPAGAARMRALPPLPAGFQLDAAPAAADFPLSEPPPGVVIHGGDGRSFIADHPEISVARTTANGSRDEAVQMQALQARSATDGMIGDVARVARPFTQGQSLGFGDELVSTIMGGVEAARGGNFGDAYDFGQEYQRQELDRRRREAPITSALTEAAGGVATGVAAAGSGATLVGRVANKGLANIGTRVAAGAAEGAGYAAASGFGGSDGDLVERGADALRNVPVGLALGGAGVPMADLMGAIFSTGRNIVTGLRNPEKHADDLLVRRIMQDRQSPDEIATAIESATAAGQPEYRALDAAGRNTQRLGAMAAKTPGEFRDTAAETLSARQEGQHDRLRGFVNEAVAPGSLAHSTEEGLKASRRVAADPLYAKAYEAPAPDGAFYAETLGRQSVKDAMSAVQRVANEKQMPISDIFTNVPNPSPQVRQIESGVLGADGRPVMREEIVNPTIRVPTMRGWDMVKRELDARVNQLYAAKDTTAAEAVKETRNALRAQLAADNPDYGAALARYSDDSAMLDAVETGRSLVKAPNADEAKAAYGNIDPDDRQLAKIGASREMANAMGENRAINQDRTPYFTKPSTRDKLDMLVDDPTVRAVFDDRLGRERDMVRSARTVTGGSNTAENLADGADVSGAGGVIAALLQGHPGTALTRGVGALASGVARGFTGMTEDTAQRVGQYLMSADPAEIRSLSDLFLRKQQAAAQPRVGATSIAAGANAPRDRR